MRERVRAVILDKGKLLTIKRIKRDGTYWVFPGGGVEEDENRKGALIREVREETGFQIEVKRLLKKRRVNNRQEDQIKYFYLCINMGGDTSKKNGPE